MKHLEVKSYRAEFKAATEGSKGIVTALVSVFNNIDLGGDRMLPGSFTKTIQDWQAKGDPLPVIWSHEWDDPQAHVGFVDPADMKETAQGLEVKMQFDLDRPFAEQVFHLQKTRRVTQFSFGYYVTDSQVVKEGPDSVREIKSVDLFEVGPTLLGMNPATQLLEAASAINGVKAGRTLNASNEEALKGARDLIDGVLSSANPDDDRASSVIGKSATKAAADEVAEGVFAEFEYNGTARGRIEHVMTEGVFGIEGSDYSLEASEEDPAVLLRIFRDTPEGFVETETLIGRRASQITVIEPVETAGKSIRPEAKANDGTTESVVTRDSGSTINQEHVIALLSKPRHTED